jgi:hypothetical protein
MDELIRNMRPMPLKDNTVLVALLTDDLHFLFFCCIFEMKNKIILCAETNFKILSPIKGNSSNTYAAFAALGCCFVNPLNPELNPIC